MIRYVMFLCFRVQFRTKQTKCFFAYVMLNIICLYVFMFSGLLYSQRAALRVWNHIYYSQRAAHSAYAESMIVSAPRAESMILSAPFDRFITITAERRAATEKTTIGDTDDCQFTTLVNSASTAA
jgi:hypothetical protein